MTEPKRRKTSSRRDQRRMHIFVKSPALVSCPKCKKPTKPHIVCKNCGYYKSQQVIDVLAKLTKKEKKAKEKEIKRAEKESKQEKPITVEELSKK